MQNNTKFVKKVRHKGPASSPEARAIRLKKLRNIANLSRKQICDKYELNVNTYKGWEIGRYGGLPLDGAKKIINRVAEEGVICSLEWLLHGEGTTPTIVTNQEKTTQTVTGPKVLQEILMYKSLSYDATFTEITDDGMAPTYNIGDYVAGERKRGDEIDLLLHKECIVELANGEVMVRKLRKDKDNNTYTLLCTNTETSVKQPILCNIKLKSAAAIARHYIK